MKFQIDPFVVRLVVGLIAVPATALAFIGLANFKVQADARARERRLADYVRRVQPQLSADPRFKFVNLQGPYVSGCVSNSEVFESLKEFIGASKPPVPISLSMVDTNEGNWRLHELALKGEELLKQADAILEAESDSARFVAPRGTNCVRTLAEYQQALSAVQGRDLAVVIFPGDDLYAYTNEVAESTALLKRCGFSEVRAVVRQWGTAWPY